MGSIVRRIEKKKFRLTFFGFSTDSQIIIIAVAEIKLFKKLIRELLLLNLTRWLLLIVYFLLHAVHNLFKTSSGHFV